jgi:hypothetical protein
VGATLKIPLKKMKTLFEIVSEIKGAKIASIRYVSEVKVPKNRGLVGVVEKDVQMQVQLNWGYENVVNNRLEKQGDERVFKAQSLRWGAWFEGQVNKIILHKGELYLRAYTMNSNTKKVVSYFVDGVAATAEQIAIIKEYEQSKNKVSATQSESGLTENQVRPMSIKFTNILELRVNGVVYDAKSLVV